MNTPTIHPGLAHSADRQLFPQPTRPCRCGPPETVPAAFILELVPSDSAPKNHQNLAQALATSRTFLEYQRAFGAVTGLPLALRPVTGWQLAHQGNRRQNTFCAMVSRANQSCSACLRMQQAVCDGHTDGPRTKKCVLGLHETAVAVKTGPEIIAHLLTGQIFFKPPTPQQTARALRQLIRWDVGLNPQAAELAYRATPVVPAATYQATLRLLQFFADQLGALANQILLQEHPAEPEPITRARRYIEAHYQEPLSLAIVSQKIGMSRFNFCRLFKQATGINFTHYIMRVRVERAKTLLLNLRYRVSEIAYEVGFQSLTHFNRAFKNIAGLSPTDYRHQLPPC
jgi:AraC-like DNA-binding protein